MHKNNERTIENLVFKMNLPRNRVKKPKTTIKKTIINQFVGATKKTIRRLTNPKINNKKTLKYIFPSLA